jgi:hypothetical protein
MDFTPEQQAAIDAEVTKRIDAMQVTQQNQLAFMAQQHANSLEIQVSNQNAAAALQSAQAAAQAALQASQAASQADIQAAQAAASLALHAKQAKLSAVQIAQTTLIANRNNQPVEAREISAADITAYAESLVAYVNG